MARRFSFVAALAILLLAGVPAAVGQRGASSVLERAAEAITSDAEARRLPGVSFAVMRRGEPIHYGAWGVADLRTGRGLTPRTPLYAGSLSKPFAALAVALAIEAGQLSLEDTVARHLPELELADDTAESTTVRQLLTHDAGMPREGGDYWFTGRFPDEAELFSRLDGHEARPGGSYSNVGYAVLGAILARATGEAYGTHISRSLRAQRLSATGGGPAPDGLSNGYSPPGRVLPGPARPFFGLGAAVGERRERLYHEARAMTPAFGLHTNARDLGGFVALALGRRHRGARLSPSVRAHLTTVQRPLREPGSGWSYGLRIERHGGATIARHDGWFAAHRSAIMMAPERGVGVAILTNADDGDPRRLARLALDVLLGE